MTYDLRTRRKHQARAYAAHISGATDYVLMLQDDLRQAESERRAWRIECALLACAILPLSLFAILLIIC